MSTLKEILDRIERILQVSDKFMYASLKVNHTAFFHWKTGRRKNPRETAFRKFSTELGIDLYQSMAKNQVVISDLDLFKKVFHQYLHENLRVLPYFPSGTFILME